MKALTLALAAVSAVAVNAAAVAADAYPSRPIRMIVPSPPGGGNDIMARLVSQRLNEAWGQAVVVDNRAGAGGAIAFETTARSAPDGYTLMIGSTNLAVLPSLTKVGFDPLKDYTSIILIATAANILLVHPGVPAKNMQELLALARAKPGALNYASGSTGASTHLAGELLKAMANVNITHIPYKGTGPAMADLLGGQVQMLFNNPTASLQLVKSGKLRALAVTGEKRMKDLPDVPTVAESGVPGYEASTWWGVHGPKNLPPALVAKLNGEIQRILGMQEVKDRIAVLGSDMVAGGPQNLDKHLAMEVAKWSKVIKSAGIRLE